MILGVGQFNKLIKKIKLLFKFDKIQPSCRKEKVSWNKSRYFIKIQDGCEQFCSYCIIPFTRGKLKDQPQTKIIREIMEAVKNGYREIVLCGIHLGLYGKSKNTNLVELLKKIINIKDLGRIRLSSIEVTEINDELIKLISRNTKICKHLHIPLQSSSDKILKSMNRPYNSRDFAHKVLKIRSRIPDIAITTDVIVGFPGETNKEFQETFKFIKKIKFSRLHVFPYSEHEKTVAANLPNKVRNQEIERRAKKLRDLGEKLETRYIKKFISQALDVIVEKKVKNKYLGKTEYYFDSEFGKKDIILGQAMIGSIVQVKINKQS
jgi:threonylcarbamoyladenosine tRNA methylthiotransferase MtaB